MGQPCSQIFRQACRTNLVGGSDPIIGHPMMMELAFFFVQDGIGRCRIAVTWLTNRSDQQYPAPPGRQRYYGPWLGDKGR